jgi:hypothetical protein
MEDDGDNRTGLTPDDLVKRAGALLSRGGSLESSDGSGPIADAELTRAVATTLQNLVPPNAPAGGPGGPGPAETATAKQVVDTARAALAKGPAQKLSKEDLSALELIVQTVGRPALRYRDGKVETPPNRLGDNSRWFVLVAQERENIDRLSRSIGRVACANGSAVPVLGTGWRIGPDLIVTNRHVAASLVLDRHAPPETWKVDPNKQSYVDFAYTDETAGSQSFKLGELLFCAKGDDLDIAILKVIPGNTALPSAIPIDWSPSALGQQLAATENSPAKFQGEEIYAVGHPYRPSANDQIREVFGSADGRKRWSPGLVTGVDSNRPILLHDCSTLGGNSGSCVIVVGPTGHTAVGLHFGGKELTEGVANAMGSTNYAVAFSHLGEHPAVQLLKRSP